MCYRYMKRRCDFLDNLPFFNFNHGTGIEFFEDKQPVRTDLKHLGSTLMCMMLSEVSDFCDPNIKENWTYKAHQQVSKC